LMLVHGFDGANNMPSRHAFCYDIERRAYPAPLAGLGGVK